MNIIQISNILRSLEDLPVSYITIYPKDDEADVVVSIRVKDDNLQRLYQEGPANIHKS